MSKKFIDVTNISNGSVSLPGHGILRAGKTTSIPSEYVDLIDYRAFISKGVIAIGSAKEVEKRMLALEKEKELAAKREKAKGLKKSSVKGKSIKRVGSDGESDDDFDNGVEPGEHDGIIFVDIEQKAERIASHPILGKKQR